MSYFFNVDPATRIISYQFRSRMTGDHISKFANGFKERLVRDGGTSGNRSGFPYFNMSVFYNYNQQIAVAYGKPSVSRDMRWFFYRLSLFLKEHGYIDESNVSVPTGLDLATIKSRIESASPSMIELRINGVLLTATINDAEQASIKTLDDSFREAVQEEFDQLKETYEADVATLKASVAIKTGFVVPLEDLHLGWASFQGGLAYWVNHHPKVIVSNGRSYRIDPKIASKAAHPIMIHYRVMDGEVFVTHPNGMVDDNVTNHTGGGGHQCTGTIRHPPHLGYEAAKKMILEVVNSLSVINMDSPLGNKLGRYTITRNFIDKHCTPVTADGNVEGGDVI